MEEDLFFKKTALPTFNDPSELMEFIRMFLIVIFRSIKGQPFIIKCSIYFFKIYGTNLHLLLHLIFHIGIIHKIKIVEFQRAFNGISIMIITYIHFHVRLVPFMQYIS